MADGSDELCCIRQHQNYLLSTYFITFWLTSWPFSGDTSTSKLVWGLRIVRNPFRQSVSTKESLKTNHLKNRGGQDWMNSTKGKREIEGKGEGNVVWMISWGKRTKASFEKGAFATTTSILFFDPLGLTYISSASSTKLKRRLLLVNTEKKKGILFKSM